MKVYDLTGRHVATLVQGMKAPGRKFVPWDATRFASGVYFYRLKAGALTQTKSSCYCDERVPAAFSIASRTIPVVITSGSTIGSFGLPAGKTTYNGTPERPNF